jgi:hypothetical protein
LLTITGTKLDIEFSKEHNLECGLVDYASISAAERNSEDTLEGCTLIPEYALSLQPAEDQLIPLFLCSPHFNSLSMGVREGVAVDEHLFGKI